MRAFESDMNFYDKILRFYPFKRQPHKMVKYNQTIRRLLPPN